MFLNTKSKNSKGNLIAQFVVLLVVAVILILVVTSFGAKIWATFFPNSDKSTVKNFDMLYHVLNAKSVSQNPYDYTPLNIYLKKDYRILFFENDEINCGTKTIITTGGGTVPTTSTSTTTVNYYKPSKCEKEKCLCLYKDEPSTNIKKKDNNVVKCYQMLGQINTIKDRFQINLKTCDAGTNTQASAFSSSGTNTEYSSYLIIKYDYYNDDTQITTPYIYVLEDTEYNQKINKELSIPRCRNGKDDVTKLCNGKKDGTVIEVKKQSDIKILETISKGCQPDFKSTSITCEFKPGTTNNECNILCKTGDETNKCTTTYKNCEGYNQIKGVYDIGYINPNHDFKYYYMCLNDKEYCNFENNCGITILEVYANRADPSGGYDPKSNSELSAKLEACKVTVNTHFNYAKTQRWFITSYDDTNPECVALFDQKFYEKQQVLACAPDKLDECKAFINTKTTDCEILGIQNGANYWITHYNEDLDKCPEIYSLFININFCTESTAPTP